MVHITILLFATISNSWLVIYLRSPLLLSSVPQLHEPQTTGQPFITAPQNPTFINAKCPHSQAIRANPPDFYPLLTFITIEKNRYYRDNR